MTQTLKTLVSEVKNREQAEFVVRTLLQNFSSNTAYDRVCAEATQLKQAPETVVQRRVANLFRSLDTRRG